MRLSGGQIQRAAARMFVREPRLLVFDDLSSALDVETERLLWERLLGTVGRGTGTGTALAPDGTPDGRPCWPSRTGVRPCAGRPRSSSWRGRVVAQGTLPALLQESPRCALVAG